MKTFKEFKSQNEDISVVTEYMPQFMTIYNSLKSNLNKAQFDELKNNFFTWIKKIRNPSKNQISMKIKELVKKIK